MRSHKMSTADLIELTNWLCPLKLHCTMNAIKLFNYSIASPCVFTCNIFLS